MKSCVLSHIMSGLNNNDPYKETEEWKQFHEKENVFAEQVRKVVQGEPNETTIIRFFTSVDDRLSSYSRKAWMPLISLLIQHDLGQTLNFLYNKYSKELRMVPYLNEIVANAVSESKNESGVSKATLMLMHDRFGVVFTNPLYYFYKKRRDIDMLKYVFELGNQENPKGMYLNKDDAFDVIQEGWLDGVKFVVEERKQMPKTIKAVALFKKLDRNLDSFPEALECIRYLLGKKILTVTHEEIASILPPAIRDNVFIISCVPQDYFEANAIGPSAKEAKASEFVHKEPFDSA